MNLQEVATLMQKLFPGWELDNFSDEESLRVFTLHKHVIVPYPGAGYVRLLIGVCKSRGWLFEFRDSGSPADETFRVADIDPKRAIARFVAQYNTRTAMMQPVSQDALRAAIGFDVTSALQEVWNSITWHKKFLNEEPSKPNKVVEVFWCSTPEKIQEAKAYFASTRERDDLCPPEDILTRSAYWASYPCGECIVVTEERWIETNEEY